MNVLKLIFFKTFPLKLLSKLFGKIGRASLPWPLLRPVLRWYIRHYNVALEEAEKPFEEFSSLNDFFTRALKKKSRKSDSAKNSIVSPVDGRILTFGKIEDGMIFQAKGMGSTLNELIDDGYREKFVGGDYIIIYLSPSDYHRIHSPLQGNIIGFSYLPGKLYPVNSFAVNNIDKLFSVNERVVSYVESDKKLWALLKVGATNVGSITLSYLPGFRSNSFHQKGGAQVFDRPVPILKGDEIGRFELGSTVILLFEKGFAEFEKISAKDKVRCGQKIAIRKSQGALWKNKSL